EPPVAVARAANALQRLLARARIAQGEAQPGVEQRRGLARARRADEHVPGELRDSALLAFRRLEAGILQHAERILEALAQRLQLGGRTLGGIRIHRAAAESRQQLRVLLRRPARAVDLPGEERNTEDDDQCNACARAFQRRHHVAYEPDGYREGEPCRRTHQPAQVHEPLRRMIATRRFLARFAALSLGTSGSESASPSARSRVGSFISAASNPTTLRARSVDSSQFDGKRAVRMGWSSVCPVTSTAPGSLSS